MSPANSERGEELVRERDPDAPTAAPALKLHDGSRLNQSVVKRYSNIIVYNSYEYMLHTYSIKSTFVAHPRLK